MISDEDRKVFLLEYRLKWLKEAVSQLSQDLARAGMSGYNPSDQDLLMHAKWIYEVDASIEEQGKRILLEVTGK